VKSVEIGKTISSKIKILVIFLLSILQVHSFARMKRCFDLAVRGFLIEADVKFYIGSINDFFIFSPCWENELRNAFVLEKGMKFIDVGAHIGKYTIRAARMVGGVGRVVAVEPDKGNFEFLIKNIKVNGLENCVVLNVAAGSTDGEIILFSGPNSAENSITQDFGKGFHKVPVRALDNILAENRIGDVDLIKVDVEGAEYEVVKGLEKTLNSKEPVLIIEVLARDKDRVLNYMRKIGYEERILNINPSYKGGLIHYSFKKRAKTWKRGI
jgi:FkbM family methyltransferase